MSVGIGLSLFGVVLYDPLGFLCTGMGLVVVTAGLTVYLQAILSK